jgi:ABC-2 type transport system permease protein
MLLGFPLLAAFVLAVTGLTYQFQGWLASLMSNPRRRRTVIVVVTMAFILIFQLPNLLNLTHSWQSETIDNSKNYTARLEELNKAAAAGKISSEEYQRQSAEANREYGQKIKDSAERDSAKLKQTASVVSSVLPPFWLALGSADLAKGDYLSGMLGGMGLALIGSFSLWRAYRTTLRIYSGNDQHGSGKAAAPAAPKPGQSDKARLTEWRLPGVSERVAGVATAAFRSYLRAPEAKMVLIFPVIMLVVFGSLSMSMKSPPSESIRPMIAFGAMAMVLFCGVQLVGNQFGYDRGGFRAYVLSPVPRRDILLGKNLAFAPFVFGLITIALIGIECLCPMRIDHFLAAFVQGVAMFLLFCLLANTVSILTPIPIAAGALQPKQVKLTPVLAQLALMFLFPIVYAPLLLPLGIEVVISNLTGINFLPIALPLMIVLLILIVFVYRWGMNSLGTLLSNREQRVLEIVTSKSE